MKSTSFSERLKQALRMKNIKQIELSEHTKIPKSAISQYISGNFEPKQDRIEIIANYLDVSEAWLMGYDVSPLRIDFSNRFPSPNVTKDYTTFPVTGDIAAGYDHIAIEEWTGDTVDIPNSMLRGRDKTEFFVLRVKGDSMYPMYQDGDRVLILKQSTVNDSGNVGAILYDDEIATLKKIEFKYGEDWLRLVPINPSVPPRKIEGEELEHCKVIGIPKLLIRDIDE